MRPIFQGASRPPLEFPLENLRLVRRDGRQDAARGLWIADNPHAVVELVVVERALPHVFLREVHDGKHPVGTRPLPHPVDTANAALHALGVAMDLLLRLVLLQHEELAVREAPDHRFGGEHVAEGACGFCQQNVASLLAVRPGELVVSSHEDAHHRKLDAPAPQLFEVTAQPFDEPAGVRNPRDRVFDQEARSILIGLFQIFCIDDRASRRSFRRCARGPC